MTESTYTVTVTVRDLNLGRSRKDLKALATAAVNAAMPMLSDNSVLVQGVTVAEVVA